MGRARTILGLALGWWLAASVLFAHYHFLHYPSRTGPFTPIPEKFDLEALPERTLLLYVAEQGPDALAAGDSVASIVSQIRMAATAWNSVETSRMRLGFGGFFSQGTSQSSPRVEVLFDEVPPGLVALGGPTTRGETVTGDDGPFVPIIRSVLILQNDLSDRPSYSDAFFLSLVHEIGHTIGLQHTLTSSVMSTAVTRASTRSKPLADDDIAGISLLYSTAGFTAQVGSISGRVTMDGSGVHLASVVALGPGGSAVSTLSDPDGYYRIGGLPPGLYYLYVHPLPPAQQPGLGPADIVLPTDAQGVPFPAGGSFETQFHPGTKEIWRAQVVPVTAGAALEGYDFSVTPSGPLGLHGVTTYSFPGDYAVKPAYVNVTSARNFFVASGVGLTENGAPASGLEVSVLGGSVAVTEDGVQAYPPAPSFLQVNLRFSPFSGEGARHLIFSRHNDLYVLPAGVTQVFRQPPSISSVTGAVDDTGNRIALISGAGLSRVSRIYFDGLPAPVTGVDEAAGTLTVQPPLGASEHRAVVTALNIDGQTSLFLDAQAPPTYVYEPAGTPRIAVLPNSLPAGTEAMVEITGIDTHFTEGQTLAGFGSSDVVVRRVWVLGPTRLLANVHISRSAPLVSAPLTVATGFEIAKLPLALRVGYPRPQVPVPDPHVVNPVTGLTSIYSGGQAVLSVANLLSGIASSLSITIDGQPATILGVDGAEVTFAVPGGLAVGPAVLRFVAGSVAAAPIVVAIDPPPPVILAVTGLSDTPVSATRPAVQGELIRIAVAGLAEPAAADDPARVRVSVGGIDHTATRVIASQADANLSDVQFTLSMSVQPGDLVPLAVRVGERMSQTVHVPVRSNDEAQPQKYSRGR